MKTKKLAALSKIIISICLTAAFGLQSFAKPGESVCVRYLSKKFNTPGEIQMDRFMIAITKIRLAIGRSSSVDNFIDIATAEDLRGSFFIIQDLFRYYYKIGYGKKMKVWFESIHNLQRSLGAYGDQIDFIKAAKAMKADPKAIAIKEQDLVKDKAELAQALLENGWYPKKPKAKTAYDEIEVYLSDRKWHTEEQDAVEMLDVMIKALKKTEPLEYDFDLLEGDGSIHQFRRDIRRTPAIMSLAVNGLFQIDKRDGDFRLNEYTSLKSTPMAQSPFASLPENPKLNYVVMIPQHYYLAISKIINDLGSIKKLGQIIEMLSDAYFRGGVVGAETPARARQRVEDLARVYYGANYFDYNEAAGQVRDELRRTGLLKEYRKLLEAARDDLKKKFKAAGKI